MFRKMFNPNIKKSKSSKLSSADILSVLKKIDAQLEIKTPETKKAILQQKGKSEKNPITPTNSRVSLENDFFDPLNPLSPCSPLYPFNSKPQATQHTMTAKINDTKHSRNDDDDNHHTPSSLSNQNNSNFSSGLNSSYGDNDSGSDNCTVALITIKPLLFKPVAKKITTIEKNMMDVSNLLSVQWRRS